MMLRTTCNDSGEYTKFLSRASFDTNSFVMLRATSVWLLIDSRRSIVISNLERNEARRDANFRVPIFGYFNTLNTELTNLISFIYFLTAVQEPCRAPGYTEVF
ncbi:hypothetical protein V8G54_007511, partial [Vigna mungo]